MQSCAPEVLSPFGAKAVSLARPVTENVELGRTTRVSVESMEDGTT